MPVQGTHFFGAAGFMPGLATQSVRFNDGSSPEIYRSYGAGESATDSSHWTVSVWIKRGNITGAQQTIFQCDTSGGQSTQCIIDSSEKLRMNVAASGTAQRTCYANRVLRDSNAWMHLCISYDNEQGTAANRLKVFINGVNEDDVGGFTSDQRGNIADGDDHGWMVGGQSVNTIGFRDHAGTSKNFFDGYMARFESVDGLSLDPTSFTETKNGVLIPKEYTGSYGNNGFKLEFKQTTVNTTGSSTTVGADTSGNDKHWSTAGMASTDSNILDCPENNFCTLNEVDRYLYTSSHGNLVGLTGGNNGNVRGTFALHSGKWYFEARNGSAGSESLARGTGVYKVQNYAGNNLTQIWYNSAEAYTYFSYDGTKYNNGSSVSYGDSYQTDEDTIGVALDLDNNAIYFSKNGTWQNSATAAEIAAGTTTNAAYTGLTGTYVPYVGKTGGTSTGDPTHLNFGQDSSFAGDDSSPGTNADGNGQGQFKYAPPTGFLAICSANLDDSEYASIGGHDATSTPEDHFNTFLYTGVNGTNTNIATNTFTPDWVWLKCRSNADNSVLIDSMRITGTHLASDAVYPNIHSNVDSAEASDAHPKIITNGIQVSGGLYDNDGYTFVVWNWKANGGTVTSSASESGSNPATSVQTNATAGFSIITYTGTGSAGTIAHGLGKTPGMIIIKNRDQADDWAVYYGDETDYFNLDNSNTTADDNTFWNDTAPTSSVFTVGTAHNVNADGEKYVAYVFAPIRGYSAFFTYEGRANADGTFIYTGFRPARVMMRNLDSAGSWIIFDNKRNGFNFDNHHVMADTTAAEADDSDIEFLSNGIKCRRSSTSFNSGHTFFIMAFADSPYKVARAV